MDEVWNRVVMVCNPESQEPSYFISFALMFGSTAAVYAFNRVSKSIWHILCHQLSLWMTVYCDDFPMLEPEETSVSAEESIGEFLDVLGWKYAKTGKKALPFSEKFDVLGVSVDLRQLVSGTDCRTSLQECPQFCPCWTNFCVMKRLSQELRPLCTAS